MSEAGERLLEGAREALEIVQGKRPAARLHIDGHTYVPEPVWQPIETAPRDGRSVLLWKDRTREYYVAAWVYGGAGPGWCTPDGFEIFGATLWIPLPPPPEPEKG